MKVQINQTIDPDKISVFSYKSGKRLAIINSNDLGKLSHIKGGGGYSKSPEKN